MCNVDSQILTRRLRFRLERSPGETTLLDRSGCNLKMEPLTSVSSLERYLLKMVCTCQIMSQHYLIKALYIKLFYKCY